MKSRQHRGWVLRVRSRCATIALTFGIVIAVAIPSAQAQTYTLLYSFQGPPLDGRSPSGRLIFDAAGNLFGTTWSGGSSSVGSVFELDTSGKETVLHSFTGPAADGAHPIGEIVRYGGNIYGATYYGGGTECVSNGCGTVFELSRSKETVVHRFTDFGGNFPDSGLARDGSGNLYGTTVSGSIGTFPPACGTQGCGTVFEVSHGQETVLYSFSGPDGENPSGNLLLDRAGNLYGTAGGGTFGQGAVFELSPGSDGTWTERLLYNFTGKSDGAGPAEGVLMDAKGNLYGTTLQGGLRTPTCPSGCGVVFKLGQNSGGTWTERVLHRFGGTPEDGRYPFGNLIRDKQGNLYGVASAGGASGFGIVFQLDAAGQETVLHTFTGGPTDGAYPAAGLTMDASGNLYGTAPDGGAGCPGIGGCGIVFKITP